MKHNCTALGQNCAFLSVCFLQRVQLPTLQFRIESLGVWEQFMVDDYYDNSTKHRTKPLWLSMSFWRLFVSAHCPVITTVFIWRCCKLITFHQQSPDASKMVRFAYGINSVYRVFLVHSYIVLLRTFSFFPSGRRLFLCKV